MLLSLLLRPLKLGTPARSEVIVPPPPPPSPSRSAFHTGRNPIHVNVWNDDLRVSNSSDPEWGQGGIPRSMTGLAAKLSSAGYVAHHGTLPALGRAPVPPEPASAARARPHKNGASPPSLSTPHSPPPHAVGKWHGGLAHPFNTPVGRGFQSSFGYLGAVNDYYDMSAWEQCAGKALTQDLWFQNATSAGPAFDRLNNRACNKGHDNSSGCVYEEFLFRSQALSLIAAHDPSVPLFLNYAPHLVHDPMEAPPAYLAKFAFIPDKTRRTYAAMVNMLDDVVGDVADALKERGMWEDTVFLVWSDNGERMEGRAQQRRRGGLLVRGAGTRF